MFVITALIKYFRLGATHYDLKRGSANCLFQSDALRVGAPLWANESEIGLSVKIKFEEWAVWTTVTTRREEDYEKRGEGR